MEVGTPTPVVITAFGDRSFTFVMKTPPNTYFLLKRGEAGQGFGDDGQGSGCRAG